MVAGRYIEYPSTKGLVNCLKRISKDKDKLAKNIRRFNAESNAHEHKDVIKHLAKVQDLSGVESLVRKLNLFNSNRRRGVSLKDVKQVYDERNQLAIPVDAAQEYIICSDDATKTLATNCGAINVTFEKLISRILDNLNPNSIYNPVDKILFMDFFLKNIQIFTGNEDIMTAAETVEFINNSENQFVCPSSLLNPRSELLQDLFIDDRSMFPPARYTDLVTNLIMLGLRDEEDVTHEDLCKAAKYIDQKYATAGRASTSLLKKANALLFFLTKYGESLQEETTRFISSKTCCPIMFERPELYPRTLPFRGDAGGCHQLRKPRDLFKAEDVYLLGGIEYIGRSDIPSCLKKFRKGNSATSAAVFDQLLLVSNTYPLHAASEHIQYMSILDKIYKFLNDCNEETPIDIDQDKAIWTGTRGTFQTPKNVWIQQNVSDIQLEPYMYPLPEELIKYEDWFLSICCEPHQTTDLLQNTLQEIHDYHQTSDRREVQRVKRDMSHVLSIVDNLAEQPPDNCQAVLLPIHLRSDDDLQLKPASQCTFCNEDWLNDMVTSPSVDDTFYFLHQKISKDTALKFKVPLLTDRFLHGADQFDMNFGQKEPITTRLRNLIKDYTDGFTIPKELIQNADDAGATTVKLLYDERTLQKAQTCLFNEGMVPCQGRAFWAFNNAKFTEEDFKNITQLAGATKKEDKMKIGRFGLGFNSVYNLTDVPSFLSGETYVIFDPHETHLGKCGLKLNLNSRLMKNKMPGQFHPFENIFGCKILEANEVEFDGSLFRFPLRSDEEASKSKIKPNSKTDMRQLLKKIVEGAGNLLLFTQHVKTVELYHLKPNSKASHPTLLMQVCKITDCPETPLKRLISQTDSGTPELVENINIHLQITKDCQNLCGNPSTNSKTPFTITWSYGRASASKKATKQQELHGLLPIAATAIVDNNKHWTRPGFYDQPHLFCFLPLPIKSKVPAHINAFFAVETSRRGLAWQNEDDINASVEGIWNRAILQDAASLSFIKMLTIMATRYLKSKDEYYRLWPSTDYEYKHDKILVNSVYRTICEGYCPVFLSQGKVVNLQEAMFLDPYFYTKDSLRKITLDALHFFVHKDKLNIPLFPRCRVVELPKRLLDMFDNFKDTDCRDQIRHHVLTKEHFYRHVIFPKMNHLYWCNCKDDLDQLIYDGLIHGNEEILEMISNEKCIPTRPNGTRKKPGGLIHPGGSLSPLFAESEECFPESQVAEILNLLQRLGMTKDDLEWEVLPQRIEKILDQPDLLLLRSQELLRYLSPRINRTEHETGCLEDVRVQLSKLRFLPVMQRTKQWRLPWGGDDFEGHPFASPAECFHPDVYELVGCIKPIVDVDKLPSHNRNIVLKWYGVQDTPSKIDHRVVIENMRRMSDYFIKLDQTKQTDTCSNLKISFRKMYDQLQNVVRNGEPRDIAHIQKLLCARPIILQGDTLQVPDRVVQNVTCDLAPYIYASESSDKKYAELFDVIGVHSDLTVPLLVNSLREIDNEIGDQQIVPKDTIECIHRICLELVKVEPAVDVDLNEELSGVKLPDVRGILTPISNLCLDDCKWIGNPTIADLHHLHHKFSKDIADKLGVKSKRTHDVDASSSDFYSDFGQHEQLTNRIKRILDGYPYDESVLKEMLQNADDAGATEVIFIKDYRTLPEKSLPHDGLKVLQGPALCIYNNSCFTESDIAGIQDLGKGSKSDEVLKTGQYGVGFNVVYHVTDVPSFWSRSGDAEDVVCICDPHCQYLQGASESKPGTRLNLPKGFKERYQDFMEGYLPKFTKNKDKGTIFRLPLRTQNMANNSQISNEATTLDTINRLMEDLKKVIFPCMLFLDSIRSVKVGKMSDNGELVIEHEVVSTMNKEDKIKHKQYIDYLTTLSHQMTELREEIFQKPLEIGITLKLELRKPTKQNEEIFIVKRAGFLPESKFPEKLKEAFSKGLVKILPRGGVAINLSKSFPGGGAYCTLPLSMRTGLPVHINGQFVLDHESRRRVRYGQDTMECQWNTHLAQYLITPAYISALLMTYPLDPRKSHVTRNRFRNLVEELEGFFPVVENGQDPFWKSLSKNLYQSIAKQRVKLFPVSTNSTKKSFQIEWVPVQTEAREFAGCFDCMDEYFDLKARDKIQRPDTRLIEVREGKLLKKKLLESTLLRLGLKILKSSPIILEQFGKSNCTIHTVTPALVLEFLKSFRNTEKSFVNTEMPHRCVLNHVPCPISKTVFQSGEHLQQVLEFVLKCVDSSAVSDQLNGAPLLLRQDGELHVYDDRSTVIISRFCDLLPDHSSRFMSSVIVNIMKKYQEEMHQLVKWDIQSFAKMLETSKPEMCQCIDIAWETTNIDWISRIWDFIFDPDHSLTNEKLLKPLMDISLLPVESGSEHRWYPLAYANKVFNKYYISPGSPALETEIKPIFTALRIPTLYFPDSYLGSFRGGPQQLVINTDNANGMLKLLILNVQYLHNITKQQASTLWKYFNSKVDDMSNISIISTLPIFETHDRQLIALDGKTCVCLQDIVLSNVPTQGLEHWSVVTGICILKYSYHLEKIYDKIHVDIIDPARLYIEYILPNFHGFNNDNQMFHLEYIRDVLLVRDTLENKKQLTETLKTVKFIPGALFSNT